MSEPVKLFKRYKNKYLRVLGNKALYDDELQRIGKEQLKPFNGVYPQDKFINKNGYQIINTSNSDDMKGEHWVALYKTPKNLYVYDSFGRNTNNLLPGLTKKMKGGGNIKIIDSDYDKEQRGESQVCGQLCMSWLCVVRDLGIRKALQI